MIKLNKKDYRLIIICVFISIICCLFSIKYFYKAFPEASIEFKITKEEAKSIAEKFLNKMGISIDKYKYANAFDYDDSAKIFLERELSADSVNKILGKNIRLWVWKNRYFVPLKKEEFLVDITTKGELVHFAHLIEEEKELPSISEDSAKILSKLFIQNEIKIDTSELNFLSQEVKKLPKRTDWTFVWKKENIPFIEAKDAEYRIKVVVQGNEIGEYKEYLHIPEKWSRDYKKLRSLNETAGSFASLFVVFLGIGLLFVLITRTRHKDIRWKTAFVFGIICVILLFIGEINLFPLSLFSYKTTESYGSFIFRHLFFALLKSIVMGALISFITASSEPIYRESYKDKISISNLFRWRSFRTKNFFWGTIIGFTFSFFFIAYQIVFYIFAKNLGAWSPTDVPYSNILSTKIPWIYVLFIGFQPAVLEEFMFRAFSIPFINKLFVSLRMRRSALFLAIILSSFIWGFCHAGYPQQPFYIRGVEVGLVGVLMSIIMIKFGILPCLVSHYTIDAFFTAFLLLRSKNLYFITTGALCSGILFIPLIICIIWYIKEKGFYSHEKLTNETEGISREPIEEKIEELHPIVYEKINNKRKVIAFVVAILLLFSFLLKKEKLGDFVKYKLTKKEAIEKANSFMKESRQSFLGTDYKCVAFTYSNFDKYGAKYILDRKGVSGVNKIYGEEITSALWCVRYFKPLEKEEYKLYIDPKTGTLYNFNHIIAEEEEGAKLPKDLALNMATNFLYNKKIDLEEYELKEVIPEKRKNRLDYTFVWEKKEIDEACLRIKVNVQGDEVTNFDKFVKVPEKWQREREKNTIFDTIRRIFMILFILFVCIKGIFLIFKKTKEVNWRKLFPISIIFVCLAMLNQINNLSVIYKNYDTSIGLNIFNTMSIIQIIVSVIGIFIFSLLCIGIITLIFPDTMYIFRKENIIKLSGDAIFCGIISLIFFIGVNNICSFLFYKFPKFTVVSDLALPSINGIVPFVSLLNNSVIMTLLIITLVSIIISVKNKNYIIILLILAAIGFTHGKTMNEFVFNLGIWIMKVGIVIFLIMFLYRNNFIAYPLSCFLLLIGSNFYSIYTQSAYKIDAILLISVPIIIILWLLMQLKPLTNKV